jgi:hypothetical protein
MLIDTLLVYVCVQMALLHQRDFPDDAFMNPALLNNLKAKTKQARQDGLNASAALMRDLQTRGQG